MFAPMQPPVLHATLHEHDCVQSTSLHAEFAMHCTSTLPAPEAIGPHACDAPHSTKQPPAVSHAIDGHAWPSMHWTMHTSAAPQWTPPVHPDPPQLIEHSPPGGHVTAAPHPAVQSSSHAPPAPHEPPTSAQAAGLHVTTGPSLVTTPSPPAGPSPLSEPPPGSNPMRPQAATSATAMATRRIQKAYLTVRR